MMVVVGYVKSTIGELQQERTGSNLSCKAVNMVLVEMDYKAAKLCTLGQHHSHRFGLKQGSGPIDICWGCCRMVVIKHNKIIFWVELSCYA